MISEHGSGNPEIACAAEEDEELAGVAVAPGAGLELEHPIDKDNANAAQQNKETSRAKHPMLFDSCGFTA